jgi:hypothetical protein
MRGVSVLPTLSTKKLSAFFLALSISTAAAFATGSSEPDNPAQKMLPVQLGEFRSNPARPAQTNGADRSGAPIPEWKILGGAGRLYTSPAGVAVDVMLNQAATDSAAYAALKSGLKELEKSKGTSRKLVSDVGSLAYEVGDSLAFVKGTAEVVLTREGSRTTREDVITLAKQLADTIPSTDNDIPALVKHLPDWVEAQERAEYAVSPEQLRAEIASQPVLDAINFSAGTEAVVAPYDNAQLAIVEFTTPQIATVNDAAIKAKIEQLKAAGQPVPAAYRRVGNYSVFVFNAADQKTAENLINGISYEQVVQWLGNNPNILRRAQKAYAATTAGIVLAVVKAAGLSLLICLGIGGLFGAYVFRQRRMRMAQANTYSDSGGMVRLNIDDLNVQSDSGRLLGHGDS